MIKIIVYLNLHSKKIKLYSESHLYNLSLFLEEDVVECEFKVNKLPKEMLAEAKRLLPNSNYVGISKKIWDKYERRRLRKMIESFKPKDFGVIIRTTAQGKNEEILKEANLEGSETVLALTNDDENNIVFRRLRSFKMLLASCCYLRKVSNYQYLLCF